MAEPNLHKDIPAALGQLQATKARGSKAHQTRQDQESQETIRVRSKDRRVQDKVIAEAG